MKQLIIDIVESLNEQELRIVYQFVKNFRKSKKI